MSARVLCIDGCLVILITRHLPYTPVTTYMLIYCCTSYTVACYDCILHSARTASNAEYFGAPTQTGHHFIHYLRLPARPAPSMASTSAVVSSVTDMLSIWVLGNIGVDIANVNTHEGHQL